MGYSSTDSCCELFKNLEVLLLRSQYIFSLLLFAVKNRDCLGLILMFITLIQDIIRTYIYP